LAECTGKVPGGVEQFGELSVPGAPVDRSPEGLRFLAGGDHGDRVGGRPVCGLSLLLEWAGRVEPEQISREFLVKNQWNPYGLRESSAFGRNLGTPFAIRDNTCPRENDPDVDIPLRTFKQAVRPGV